MASVAPVSLTISLPADVAGLLKKAASDRGWTPESLAADCIAQQLEVAVRHRVALERIDQVDGAILELAKAIGTIEAGSEGIDLADFCRYGKRS
ncbi:MAG: hypothetical protein DI537_37275 [Stutzerimonas stutzeri]|nr:MAG: hypothetical protein DI537_37275 [Stutzerimonas stutzeri]